MRALYWRKFSTQEWTRTHFVKGDNRKTLCGEAVLTESSREDTKVAESRCCKRCWKKVTDAERERALAIYR